MKLRTDKTTTTRTVKVLNFQLRDDSTLCSQCFYSNHDLFTSKNVVDFIYPDYRVVVRHRWLILLPLPLLQRLVVRQLAEHSMPDREHLRLRVVAVVVADEDQVVELLVVVELVVLSVPKERIIS